MIVDFWQCKSGIRNFIWKCKNFWCANVFFKSRSWFYFYHFSTRKSMAAGIRYEIKINEWNAKKKHSYEQFWKVCWRWMYFTYRFNQIWFDFRSSTGSSKLVGLLQNLSLTINQAGSYMRKTGTTVAEDMKLYNHAWKRLMASWENASRSVLTAIFQHEKLWRLFWWKMTSQKIHLFFNFDCIQFRFPCWISKFTYWIKTNSDHSELIVKKNEFIWLQKTR